MIMNFKNVETIGTSDIFYDFFLGGYFKPENFLENEKDIKRVREAKEVIEEYLDGLESEGLAEEI